MQLKSILETSEKGIFQTYKEKYKDDFILIYENDTEEFTQLLDVLFLSNYGNRSVISLLENKSNDADIIDFIAFLLHIKCNTQLLEIKEILAKDYNVLQNIKETITENTQTTGNTQNKQTFENVNNTYGFDSNDSVKDNSSNSTDDTETTIQNESIKTYEKLSSNLSVSQSDLIDKEIKRKVDFNFIDLTFSLFANNILLDVYE